MTPTTRLILLRHGAVEAPWPARIYGRLDVPLSAEGRAEARGVATALADVPLAGVVSSGLARAEYTAALLRGPRGLGRRDDPELVEMDRGSWAGRERTELARSDPERWAAHRAVGGARGAADNEPMEAVRERVRAGLDRAADLAPGEQVAVVAHLWVLRAAVVHTLGLEPEAATRVRVPTSGLVVLEWPHAAGRGAGLRPTLVALAPDRLPERAPPT